MSGPYELGSINNSDTTKGGKVSANPDALPDVVVIKGGTAGYRDDQLTGLPNDRYNLVFIILLIHGIGTLMPWNMFINADTYFKDYKLAPPANGNSTSIAADPDVERYRKDFMSYLGLASQLPNVLFNGLNLLVNIGSGNVKLRVNLTLAVEAVIFTITIILAVVDSSQWQKAFFYVTMLSVVVLNMASGVYQNCIFGTGAKFPGSYTNAILIGSNFSGTFTSIVNLLSIWLAPEPQKAAMYYFITALFVILICLISYNSLPYNLFFRYFDRSQQPGEAETNPFELEIGTATTQDNNNTATTKKENSDVPEILRQTVDAMVPRPSDQREDTSFMGELMNKKRIFMQCWPQCLNVFLTFFVTLALFPAVLSNIRETQGLFTDKYFTSFACFFIFNVFAMIGNLISGWTTWPGKDRVWMMVVARFAFIPFFLFCNFITKGRKWPILIENDIVYIIGNILFAASSGYLSSLCMMFAASGLKSEDAPKAGMLAAFFLVFGIFIGVNCSFLLTRVVELG